MKNLKITALVAGLFVFSFGSFAQSDNPEVSGTASISDSYCVTLDDSKPIQKFYEISISHLGLETEYDAKKKFGYISNNLLTYKVDFENDRVILQVHNDRTGSPKGVAWWNDYLSSLCK